MLKYDHEIDMSSDNSASLILRRINHNSKVLEFGPATGYMTKYMKEILNCRVYCVELDPEAAKKTRIYAEKMIVANLDDLQWIEELRDETFDYIIFADVLEHLYKFEEVLALSKSLLNQDGVIISSIPNIGHNAIIMELLQGNFAYKKLGLLDETHVHFFTRNSLVDLFGKVELDVIEWLETHAAPEETEFIQKYENFPEDAQKMLLQHEDGHVYQFITILKNKEKDKVWNNPTKPSYPSIERQSFLQIYWIEQNEYLETNSIKTPIAWNSKPSIYRLVLPGNIRGLLRIDPINWSSYIEILNISVYEKKGENLNLHKISNSLNGYSGLSAGDNVTKFENSDCYSFLCNSPDPQLFYETGIEEIVESIVIDIELRVCIDRYNGIISSYIKKITSYNEETQNQNKDILNQFSLNLQALDDSNRRLESVQSELKDNKKSFLELQETKEKIVSELLDLQSSYVQLNRSNNELIRSNNELIISNNELTFVVEQQDKHISDFLNSRSWRMTSLFRYWGFIVKKTIKGFLNAYFILSGHKFKMKLVPVQQIETIEGTDIWRSTGDDPHFLLAGSFPCKWVKLEWESKTDQKLTLKLYWEENNMMSEKNSYLIGSMGRQESVKLKKYFFLSPNAKVLRLDPGDTQAIFNLSNVTFTKISRVHVVFARLKEYFGLRGLSISTFMFFIVKICREYRKSGIQGLWNKVKRISAINSSNKDNMDYQEWIIQNESSKITREEIVTTINTLSYQPLFSVILPVYNVDEKWLRKCVDSVRNQYYDKWELCIADDASTKPHIRAVLEEYLAIDSRIKVVFREKNGHISESSNSAIEVSTGEFIALLDHDDELAPDALFENVLMLNKHPDADVIYSDEDKISADNVRHTPYFKPDWSPDMLLSQMYTCHLGVYRTSLVKEISGFRRGYEGSQDYDLMLRITEKTNKIYHIPKILYHWRSIPESTASGSVAKDYTNDAGFRAVNDALIRRGVQGWVESNPLIPNLYLVHYESVKNPKVSIIIPTRNMSVILQKCLHSIFNNTSYSNYEVIIVDNGSDEEKLFELFNAWLVKEPIRFRVEKIDVPFNYSYLNNQAVKLSTGELILLLNNDIEVISSDWLGEMVGQALRKNIGAVGACLLYPDNTIQHGGIILGIGGVAGHSHKYYDSEEAGYFSRLKMVSNYSAVTAACLMVRREVYEEVHGLNEELSVAFNDVDFCLRIRELGYLNIWLPQVKLYHYESKSRGQENTPDKIARFNSEVKYMQKRWGKLLLRDPYYNPNLTLEHEDFSL